MASFDLVGNFTCRLDEKGRLKLPSEVLAQLGEEHATRFVLNKGYEKCLVLYPKTVWERFTDQLKAVPDFMASVREFKREFYRESYPVSKDGSGRILLSKSLLDYAGVDREVSLICQGDKIEIWRTESFEEKRMDPADFAALAEQFFANLYKSNS